MWNPFLSSVLAEPASTKENNCLNAAKACNLNDTCKKYRSAYINPCTSRVSASEVCNKRKCHKALRQFFDKVIKQVWERLLRLTLMLTLKLICILGDKSPGKSFHRVFKLNSLLIQFLCRSPRCDHPATPCVVISLKTTLDVGCKPHWIWSVSGNRCFLEDLYLVDCMKVKRFTSLCFVLFPKSRFQLNTATGCFFAPVQREIGRHAPSAGDKPSYRSVPTRIKTDPIVCLSRTHARPITSAGKTG